MKQLVPGLIGLVTLSMVADPAWSQRKGQASTINVGTVLSANRVKLQSDAGKGAALGGIIGAVTQSGRSTKKKAKYGLLGAGLGAAAGSTTGGEGIQYAVKTPGGQILTVITDQTEIRVGDCVQVEQSSGGSANVRRVNQATCAGPLPDLGPTINQELQSDAADCVAAKEALMAAETDAQISSWIRKVKVICDS